MYMSFVTKTTLVVVAALTLVPSAYAGGAPKGKPFIQLGNQIIELQGQLEQTIQQQAEQLTIVAVTAEKVDTLEETVGTLEDRVVSLEERVTTTEENLLLLKTKATNQENQINELISGALAHGVDILALQGQLATVNQQIATLETEVDVHTDQIAVLQAKATSLSELIETNALGLFALQEALKATNKLIEALEEELGELKLVLETKQNIINHTCDTGLVVVGISPTGGVGCTAVGGSSGELQPQTWFNTHNFTGAAPAYLYECPTGTVLTSGAFLKIGSGKEMTASVPDGNAWKFQVASGGGGAGGVGVTASYILYIQCLALTP